MTVNEKIRMNVLNEAIRTMDHRPTEMSYTKYHFPMWIKRRLARGQKQFTIDEFIESIPLEYQERTMPFPQEEILEDLRSQKSDTEKKADDAPGKSAKKK